MEVKKVNFPEFCTLDGGQTFIFVVGWTVLCDDAQGIGEYISFIYHTLNASVAHALYMGRLETTRPEQVDDLRLANRELLWIEDDGLAPDREKLSAAYQRIFGKAFEPKDALAREELGDGTLHFMAPNALVLVSYPTNNCIWRLS